MKKYYTVKEAGRLLGVSTNTIYKYLDEGGLVSRRIGKGRFKILYSSLAPYINTGNVASTSLKADKPEDKQEEVELSQEPVAVQAKQVMPVVTVAKEEKVYSTPSGEDHIFLRIFKGMFLLGLGMVFLFSSLPSFGKQALLGSGFNDVLFPVLPYILLLLGVLTFFGSYFKGEYESYQVGIHLATILVLGYLALLSLASGHFTFLIFSISILGLIVNHVAKGMDKGSVPFDFRGGFTRYLFLVTVVSGVVIFKNPELIPFVSLVNTIALYKSIIILSWFGIVVPLLLYSLTSEGSKTRISQLGFLILGILSILLATGMVAREIWDSAYLAYLTSIFSFFGMIWGFYKEKIDLKNCSFLI